MKLSSLGAALVLVAGTAPALFAQSPPIKWGDVPEEHLLMTTFPADTNAAAVVLADYATLEFERDYSTVYKHHRRVKILKESAYDAWGSVTIPYYAEDHTQRVRDVRGQTFTLGPDGKPQRHAMDRAAIFDEDVDGEYRRVRFTLPALAPGAVVEYQYTLRTDNPFSVPDWHFQLGEPVLWSEFRPEFPKTLGYVQATRGIVRFDVQEQKDALRDAGETTLYRLVMRDVPALREEPYMTTPEDYRARLEFQLASYFDQGLGRAQQVLHSWAEVAKTLIESDAFGRQLDRPRRNVRDQVAALTAGIDDPAAKLRALYDYVRTNITFNGDVGIFLDQDLDDVLQKREGSSPEIALLLVSMLREAGLEADPVLISTRSHGSIIDIYPLLSQFNDVIVYAEAGGQPHLLDATNPHRPYDLLPFDALNGRGWRVRKMDAQWIDIKVAAKYVHQSAVRATLSPDGTLSGVLEASDDGYSALFKRSRLEEDGAEKLVREVFLDGLADVTLDSHRVDNADAVTELLRTSAGFQVPAYAQAAGDFLYVNPTVVDRIEENPLRLPERTFPVDYGYAGDQIYTLRLVLPEGYEVQEKPATMRLSLPGGGGSFTRSVDVENGVLVVQSRLVRAKSVYAPGVYADLRAFYDRVVAAQAEQVVLKRTGNPTEGTP